MKPKNRRNSFRVVPWTNPDQFKKVYDCLYSDSLSQKRWAVDQVSVWNTRCHPALPLSVDSTVCIVRAVVHDMLYQADKTFCQEEDIQMLYSMALIRFVNLTLEQYQKANGKMRLSYLAAKHNIPPWLLDLRNEASHSFCPSVSMLRMGAGIALDYLDRTFWSKEVENCKMINNLPSDRDAETINLINQYKSLQFERAKNADLKRSMCKDLSDVLKKMGTAIFHDGKKFIDNLVQPGNFIAAGDIKQLVPLTAPFIALEDNLILPKSLQTFWLPLLRKIHVKDLMPLFLEKLLLAQENCRIKICQKTAIAWALQILIGVSPTSSLSDCFKKKKLLLNIPRLLYACLKGTTPYSVETLRILIEKWPGNHKSLQYLFYMMAVYQGKLLYKNDLKRKRDTEEIIFTVEDVEEELNEIRAKKMRAENEENVWFTPSVTMNFSNIPVGAILTPVNLDASQDKQSLDDSCMDYIKFEPTIDDTFILINKNDGEGTVEEENTHNTFSVTTRPENFDMIYRRRPKQ